MDLSLVFGSLTNLFVLGWLMLVAGALLGTHSRARARLLFLGGRAIPLLLLAAFCIGWAATRHLPGDIYSFEGVLAAFSVPQKALNAWVEVLGLALLASRWLIDDSTARVMPRPLLLPALVACFFAAALGLVTYLLILGGWNLWTKRAGAGQREPGKST